jgi:hypothetical protein
MFKQQGLAHDHLSFTVFWPGDCVKHYPLLQRLVHLFGIEKADDPPIGLYPHL